MDAFLRYDKMLFKMTERGLAHQQTIYSYVNGRRILWAGIMPRQQIYYIPNLWKFSYKRNQWSTVGVWNFTSHATFKSIIICPFCTKKLEGDLKEVIFIAPALRINNNYIIFLENLNDRLRK